MKIAVLLSGAGVYDGSEIQESVFALLAIAENNAEYICVAPDREQLHVINHLTGEVSEEQRNIKAEAARIARGKVKSLGELSISDFDAVVIPGGFGAAKNFNHWAIEGPDGMIHEDVKQFILDCVSHSKPIAALCMAPTVVAKALQGSEYAPLLTVGTTEEASPYDIDGINQGLESINSKPVLRSVRELAFDEELKIVSAPCYMMEASIVEVRKNVKQAIDRLVSLV